MSERVGKRDARGFTLMELMVVVVLISILAFLAVPQMGNAMYDREAYNDAGLITELFRMARTRAIARGGAVMVHVKADQATQHGLFEIWEAVSANSSGAGLNRTPVSSCKAPTQWLITTNSTSTNSTNFVDAVNMNGQPETNGKIYSQIFDPTTLSNVAEAFLCYTPLGHVYYVAGSLPVFDTTGPMTGVLQIQVTRQDSTQTKGYMGPLRTILVPGAGMARLVSK